MVPISYERNYRTKVVAAFALFVLSLVIHLILDRTFEESCRSNP